MNHPENRRYAAAQASSSGDADAEPEFASPSRLTIGVIAGQAEECSSTIALLHGSSYDCLPLSHKLAMHQRVSSTNVDLLVIDINESGTRGADLIRVIRCTWALDTPIVAIGICRSEATLISLLKAGADDYLTRPVRPLELQARIDALCRRAQIAKVVPGSAIHAGAYELDCHRRLVRLGSLHIPLTQKEFELALLFFSNPGRTLSNAVIENAIWGYDRHPSSRALAALISRLRRTLQLHSVAGISIAPVYAEGYRLEVTAHMGPAPAIQCRTPADSAQDRRPPAAQIPDRHS